MKKVILFGGLIFVFASLTVYGQISKQYTAFEANYKIEIDGVERNLYHPIVTIDDKAYVALTDFASWTGRTTTWLPEQNKIRVIERNKDVSKLLIPYRDNATKKEGFKDCDGNIVIEPNFYEAFPFSEGYAVVAKFDKNTLKTTYGYINDKGEVVIPCIYDFAGDFDNGIAIVGAKDQNCPNNLLQYYLKKDGNFLFNKGFSQAHRFSEGYACVVTSGLGSLEHPLKWSFIDMNGEFATDFEFDDEAYFENGYADVILNGVEGYIDSQFNFYEGKR